MMKRCPKNERAPPEIISKRCRRVNTRKCQSPLKFQIKRFLIITTNYLHILAVHPLLIRYIVYPIHKTGCETAYNRRRDCLTICDKLAVTNVIMSLICGAVIALSDVFRATYEIRDASKVYENLKSCLKTLPLLQCLFSDIWIQSFQKSCN